MSAEFAGPPPDFRVVPVSIAYDGPDRRGLKMSLTEELKTKGSWTRTFFEHAYPNPAAVEGQLHQKVEELLTIGPVSTVGYPWGAVGMALDYRDPAQLPRVHEAPR